MPALKDGYVSSPGRRRVPRDGTCPAGGELGAPEEHMSLSQRRETRRKTNLCYP